MQRAHNFKSLSPIAQIDIGDFPRAMYVHIQNKGVGPMTIRRLTFFTGDDRSEVVERFIPLEPREYLHTNITNGVQKSILSQEKFVVFHLNVSDASEAQKVLLRKRLAGITVQVDYVDIYNRKFRCSRELDFFIRHIKIEG
jgi:hypothetical protein